MPDPITSGYLGLAQGLVDLLKGVGILKDPEMEMKARQLANDLEAKWLTIVQPQPTLAPGLGWFANTLGALQNFFVGVTRPAITWIVIYGIIFGREQMAASLKALSEAGTAGLLLLAIPLSWFWSRAFEKLSEIRSGFGTITFNKNGKNGNGNGATTKPLPTNGDAAPFTSKTGFRRDE